MTLQGLVHLATLQGEYAHVSLPRWGFLLNNKSPPGLVHCGILE